MAHPSAARFETLAIHAGNEPDATTGAVSVPIYLTSTYAQKGPGEHSGYEYSRTQNPTRHALERNLAALEGSGPGKETFAYAFASGCAATATLLHTLDAGAHVVAGDDLYGGTYRLFERVFRNRGLTFTYVDATDPDAVEAAMTPATRLVWIETPTNPLLKVSDIGAVAARCRPRSIRLAVDSTFMTPYLQQPLSLGADYVVHSTTKYLGGHADVVGGAVITNDPALATQLQFHQNAIGAVPSPLDCFLVLRGTKTLAVRMERQQSNAAVLAARLAAHRDVARVIYPGLPAHPQHALVARQCRGAGAMISFALRGDAARAARALRATKLFACAESLGGVESLIESPALMTHASVPAERRAALGIDDGLLRISVGIEHVEDLWNDLEAAFAA
jgi:cystathionine gamma-lyase